MPDQFYAVGNRLYRDSTTGPDTPVSRSAVILDLTPSEIADIEALGAGNPVYEAYQAEKANQAAVGDNQDFEDVTFTGDTTLDGPLILTNTNIGSSTVIPLDVARPYAILAVDRNYTFAGGSLPVGRTVDFAISSSADVQKQIGIPTSYSRATGKVITSFMLQPGDTRELGWSRPQGSTIPILYGEQDTVDLVNSPLSGESVALVGASIDMREMRYAAIAEGAMVADGTTITCTITGNGGDHLWHNGHLVLVGSQAENDDTAAERLVLGYGRITRVGSTNAFTVPQVAGGACTNTGSKFWVVSQQQHTFNSRWVFCQDATNFARRHEYCFGLGSTNTEDLFGNVWKYIFTDEVLAKVKTFEGTWAVGNSVTNAITNGLNLAQFEATVIPWLREMWTQLTKRGKLVKYHGVPTPTNGTAQAHAYGKAIETSIKKLSLEPTLLGFVTIIDESTALVVPGTTNADTSLISGGAGVHPSRKRCESMGWMDAKLLMSERSLPEYPGLISNPWDRFSQNAQCEQFWETGWDISGENSKVTTSGLTGSSKFTGSTTRHLSDANITGSNTTVAWSQPLREDGFGYNIECLFTNTTAATHIFTAAFAGDAAVYLIKDKIQLNREYTGKVNLYMQTAVTDFVKDVSISISGATTYGGVSKTAIYSSAITNNVLPIPEDSIQSFDLNLEFPEWMAQVIPDTLYVELRVEFLAKAGVATVGFGRLSIQPADLVL